MLTQGATQLLELCGGDEVNSFHLSTRSRPSAILLEKQGSDTTIHDSDYVDDVIWVRKPFFRAVVDRFSVWQRRNALSGPNNLMKPYTCRRVESKETGEEVRYNSVSCKYISVLSTCNVVLHI